MKIKVTKSDIIENPLKVLVCGLTMDNHKGINIDRSNKDIRFVLKCGGAHDFAVYVGHYNETFEQIENHGQKVSFEYLKNIFEFEEGVEEMYRW